MFEKKFLLKQLKVFLKIYKYKPISNNYSGMKVEHCFALYCFLKKIKPKYVIESGVWKGQTTWLIKKTLKNVKLFSIDIDLSQKEIDFKDVVYLNKDITKYNWDKINKDNSLIIFDDHVCFSERIDFLIKNKFKHIIFDDNLPNNFISYYTPKMIYEKQILIKKKFVKYTNIKRLISFLYDFLFSSNFKKNLKIKFYNSNVQIIFPPKINNSIKSNFKTFRKKIKIYYEFPPIIKFNLNKRFNKIIKNFDMNIRKHKYNVKKPITNINEFKFNKNLIDEMSSQYGNICYLKLK